MFVRFVGYKHNKNNHKGVDNVYNYDIKSLKITRGAQYFGLLIVFKEYTPLLAKFQSSKFDIDWWFQESFCMFKTFKICL